MPMRARMAEKKKAKRALAATVALAMERGRGGGAARGPRLRVTLIAMRRTGRELDDDNLRGGCKHLRDAIAAWLGLDDADSLIEWEYGQQHTRGREGVCVKIEPITRP